jgi:hypothetical protein
MSNATTARDTLVYEVTITDLWAEEGGWSGNYNWVRRFTVSVPADWSDLRIARKIKRVAGLQGWRTDFWAGCDFCWRNECVGAYAELRYE